MIRSLRPLHASAGYHRRVLAVALAGLCMLRFGLSAAEPLEDARQFLLKGEYTKVIALAQQSEKENLSEPDWLQLQAEALGRIGRYPEARAVLDRAVERFPVSLRLRLASYEALRRVGAVEEAKQQLTKLDQLRNMRAWSYRTPADRVALAQVCLLLGDDPKPVLEIILDPVKKAQPEFRDTYLVSGELALTKSDYSLAGKTFNNAAKKFPEDPEAWFGVARAFAPSDPEASLEAAGKALKLNPQHVGAHLLIADHAINAEDYPTADRELAEALKVDPQYPEAHAYRAVLAHLRSDEKTFNSERAAALKFWAKNPAVPHLIGRKLSQKYRFAEGTALQREALKWDADYLPAKAQLANDLLRLGGHDDEAWQLADEVQKADPYDVVAYNLTALRDAVANFKVLTSEHFSVKMEPGEAEIYGADVLALLERAHDTLTKKYGLQLRDKTIVEIFPDQKDFAIRTFGLPGGAGYLGVCFGRVITATSPASRLSSPNSWEAVLWHEFCHVVTLTLTKNKMPRWLSEGISVYEERQARGNWGENMKPRYRAMILGEDLTPVSQLSGAFLQPKSAAHIGFAYYESSLAVEWMIERWGLDKLKRVLADLARGVEINAALATHFEPIEKLDADFAAAAQKIAKNTGPKLDWKTPEPAEVRTAAKLQEFIAKNPDNFTALQEQARELLGARKWAEAKVPLQKLIEHYPDQRDGDSAYAMLSKVHRELGETDAELAVLNKLTELNSNATPAFERLIVLARERHDWPAVIANAERYAEVNPLSVIPHQAEAEAREKLDQKPAAIAAYRALLQLGPEDAAGLHFKLARLLHAVGDPAAKREVLLALEDTPRFRAALDLLLEINGQPSAPPRVNNSDPQ